MIRKILTSIIFMVPFFADCTNSNHAIDIKVLKDLKLAFTTAKSVTTTSGSPLIAEVTVKQGQQYILSSPTNIQQIEYLVENGKRLKKGDSFAILRGNEVHHFLIEFESKKTLFQLAKKRLENNKKLVRQKAISEERWVEINQNYSDTFLEYEHMRHFHELISNFQEQDESITIKAPIDGVIHFSEQNSRNIEESILALFIPINAIRLSVMVPIPLSQKIHSFGYQSCQFPATQISRIAQGAFIQVWSEQVSNKCGLIIGQTLSVTPYYQNTAFQIPKSAVFSLEGSNRIFYKEGEKLKSVKVSLLTGIENDYLVQSESSLSNKNVLTSSVSAVQGILLGLGRE